VELELRRAWVLDLPDDRRSWATFDDVCGRHREPHRRYHGLAHVLNVLRTVGELLVTDPLDDPAPVRLAAWFHDAVYDPRSVTNEQDSAALARRRLPPLGVGDAHRAEIERLILLTAHNSSTDPADRAAAVLLDADLAVLAADPAVYDAYRNGVRTEYAHVSEDAWRDGRAAVLRSLLDRPNLFATEVMRLREPVARANLTAELTSLRRTEPHAR
jgi:predicted metal-dependent HD superfamily phosphohydrolase